MRNQKIVIPPAVNFHLWPKCNLNCTFCYAGFPDARGHLPTRDAEQIIAALAKAGVEKLTFVGGEPTLHPDLARLVRFAASLGLVTCIVSNGARLLRLLDDAAGAVHWVGLSVDSAREDIQTQLGRGEGNHVGQSIVLAKTIRDQGIQLKLNTVVTSLNWQEDLSDLVRVIQPERWKAFQVLRVEGENDGRVEPLMITAVQFASFVDRHGHLAKEGLGLLAEDNDTMRGSYAMIDPLGRFFSNEHGPYRISQPIMQVGIEAALSQVMWRQDKLIARGGVYQWR